MREGTSIADFDNPGTIVVGVSDTATAELMRAIVSPHTPREVPIATAEAVKYANNAWHGLKVTFANEIGRICKAVGIDGHDVMDALVSDTKLNTSGAYLKPGFAFGGSCLPKDISALRHRASSEGVATPVLDAILAGNETQIEEACNLVAATGNSRIGIVGLSFKPGTDDLRRSPLLELAARLLVRGMEVHIYEPALHESRAGRADLGRLGDLGALLVADAAALIEASQTIVIGNARLAGPLMDDFARAGVAVVDLARVDRARRSAGGYRGIAW
jgi:GDP-mannose 6-dehydrogenase